MIITRTAIALVAMAAGAVALPAPDASAQFTADPASPSLLARGANDQVQPKVVPIPSGGFYMSWYDNATGGYDPMVQRFDANGVSVWPAGVKVLDTNFSSTEDYGFTMDAAGNAVIVTRSDVGGGVKVVAQAISPSGAILWAPGGVQLSASTSINSPRAGRAGDGAAVAGWTESSRAKVLRLNPDGSPAWSAAATVSDGTATTFISDLQPGDGGSVIASVVRYTTFSGAKTIQAQKFSASGAAQWVSTNVRVFTAGSLQFGNFPTFLPDGEGGAIFTWYTTGPLQSWAQWVSPTGALRFGTSGAAVTSTTEQERTGPTAAYDPATRRVYVAFTAHTPNSSIYGTGGQAFDEAGTRLWGDAGLMCAPMETVYQHWQARVAMLDGFPTFSWTRTASFGSEVAYAQSYAADATQRWTTPSALTGTTSTARMVFQAGSGSPSCVLAIWENGGTGNADIVGNRLNPDGSLGTPAVFGDLNGDSKVNGGDLGIMLGDFGTPPPGSLADLNHDGVVTGADIGLLLGAWTS